MSDDLLPLVNASGFAFQLAVEEAVRVSRLKGKHAWSITSREHGWRDGDAAKFIDLILTRGKVHLVVECKRMRGGDSRGAEWVFLVPDPPYGRRAEPRRWFRAQYLRDEDAPDGPRGVASFYNFQMEPLSWESSFCIVPGASDKERPMLDRISAELARSADALLDQQLRVLGYADSRHFTLGARGAWVGLPLIVTTARLFICRFDPAIVPLLTNGLLPEGVGQWTEVPWMRYRKSFDAPARAEGGNLGELEEQWQRTIAIVTATHLVDWLRDFAITTRGDT